MPSRVRFLKRLLYRLLLTTLLFVAPAFLWARVPIWSFVFEDSSSRTAETDESFGDDAEWEECSEDIRLGSHARLRVRRSTNHDEQAQLRSFEVSLRSRFSLVVDVRRIKPKRLFAPPYVHPRFVRLLS
ncbi:MAG TPA: hypothetical protein PK156_02455 [Polyangium sp.]|nr:hypothetical protein [Polyangium sp.]